MNPINRAVEPDTTENEVGEADEDGLDGANDE